MVRMLTSAVIYILANAVALFVTSLVLGASFILTFKGFVVATLLLSVVEALAGPLITRMSERRFPALSGSVALITTFVGLWITTVAVGGMEIHGLSTWLLATILVWAIALIASFFIAKYLIEQELATGRLCVVFDRPMEMENSYYLVVPEGKLENPLSQAFRAWIARQMPK